MTRVNKCNKIKTAFERFFINGKYFRKGNQVDHVDKLLPGRAQGIRKNDSSLIDAQCA